MEKIYDVVGMGSPLVDFTADLNRTLVPLNNPVADSESQASAVTGGHGGVKGVKNVG